MYVIYFLNLNNLLYLGLSTHYTYSSVVTLARTLMIGIMIVGVMTL